jgi:hypothetical protein
MRVRMTAATQSGMLSSTIPSVVLADRFIRMLRNSATPLHLCCSIESVWIQNGRPLHVRHAGRDDSRRTIEDAGMVLADPAVRHQIAVEVVRCIYSRVVRFQKLPRDDKPMVLLLQLLQLSFDAFAMARGEVKSAGLMQHAPAVLVDTLLPILAAFVGRAQIARAKVRSPLVESISDAITHVGGLRQEVTIRMCMV